MTVRVLRRRKIDGYFLVERASGQGPSVFRWLPEQAVPQEAVERWRSPCVADEDVRREVVRLRRTIAKLLQSKRSGPVRREIISFRHDVLSQVFGSEAAAPSHRLSEYTLDRFPPAYFPTGWNTYVSKSGDGFFAESVFMAPRLRTTKGTHVRIQDTTVHIPDSELYEECLSVKFNRKPFTPS